MFLPTSTRDYANSSPSRIFPDEDSDTELDESPTSSKNGSSAHMAQGRAQQQPLRKPHTAVSEPDDLPALSQLSLSPSESHLWAYFHNAIAPSCVLDPARNPYQDIILRIAASTGNSSPLFHSIMAISASQRYLLGNKEFYEPSWAYRHKALQSLRHQTTKMEDVVGDQSLEAQILATVMAMVFLDVSNCVRVPTRALLLTIVTDT